MGILSFLPRPGIPQYTWNEQTQEWSSPVQEAGKNCKMYLENSAKHIHNQKFD